MNQHWTVCQVLSTRAHLIRADIERSGRGGAQWFVVTVSPNCLARVEGELGGLGYRTFTPKLRKWISHARVRKAAWRPILGRYLFVDLAGGDFHQVRSTNGVESIVGVAGEPRAVPEDRVLLLMARQMAGEWDLVAERRPVHCKRALARGRLVVEEWEANSAMPIGARLKIIEGQFQDELVTLVSQRRGQCSVKVVGTNIYRTIYPVHLRPAA